MTDDVTRPFPHAIPAEKYILSAILQDSEFYIGAAMEAGINSGHFYLPSHATLFETFLEFAENGKEIEIIGLIQWLLDHGKLERVGGPSAVSELYTYAASCVHFHHRVKEIQAKRILRDMINVCNVGIANAYDAPGEPLETLDALERDILAIREQSEATAPSQTLKDSVKAYLDDLTDAMKGQKPVACISTGFEELDRMSNGGMRPGDMFVVAARPSMGKTAFMMNVVEHVSLDLEKPTGVFSVEMSQDQLVARLISARAKIPLGAYNEHNKADKGELQRIQRIAMGVAEAKDRLLIDQREGITINQIRAKARRWKREFGIEFIAIDYLQLIRSKSKQAEASREREVAEISSGIKGLAKELGIAIMILAQLNRGPEGRTGKNAGMPRMSDLRESGSIEQDADMVGLLYRHAYYAQDAEAKEEQAGRAQLDLAKNRNGQTGIVPLTFIAELTRFETGAPYIAPQAQEAQSRWDR